MVRAIAILAMIYVHILPTGWLVPILPPAQPSGVLDWLAHNLPTRPMSLFVVCAGVSAALMTGGRRPPEGHRLTMARRRLAMRSAALLPFALLMDWRGEPILLWYCVWFLLLLPVLKLGARTLMIAAGTLAVASPVVTLLVLNLAGDFAREFYTYPSVTGFALLVSPAEWPSWALFYLTHPQALYALPLLLAGMAAGRLDLHDHAIRLRLLTFGLAAVVLSCFVSWLVATPLGGRELLHGQGVPGQPGTGSVPALALLMAPPHQLYAMSIPMVAMSIGIAATLLGGFLIVMDRPAWQRVLWPIAATGSLALTCYVGHFALLIPFGEPPLSFHLYVSFFAFFVLFSTTWRQWGRRGPLEWIVHRVITLAVRDRPLPRPAPAVVAQSD